MSTNAVLDSTLLALQLCLGFWQIMKITAVGALIRCAIDWCLLPLGLSSSYARLQGFRGRIFKKVCCHVTTAGDQTRTRGGDIFQIKSRYLGVDFRLERREDKLLLNGAMAYYITHKIWNSLVEMASAAPFTVFVKGYKEFWQGVASGDVMSLEEVLDCLILDNHIIVMLDKRRLLPVNLLVSEEKLLKVLNLVGLFLQIKRVYWLIPLMLSFTAGLLELCTSLRVWLYALINAAFCSGVRVLCERLPLGRRGEVYSLGKCVENGIELRVVRGDIRAVIGGGAKVDKEGATLVQAEPVRLDRFVRFSFAPIKEIICAFDEVEGRSWIWASNMGKFYVGCTQEEFERLITFVSSVARNGSGSLRCCSHNTLVRVRSFRESVMHYATSGFPPVYELQVHNAVLE